ncbi:MAG: hypothetical protein ACP5QT_06235 [Brevinematia bacterium]
MKRLILIFLVLFACGCQLNPSSTGNSSSVGNSSSSQTSVFSPSGILDDFFGTGGIAITPVGDYDDYAYKLVIQSDGKIVLGGYVNNSTNNDSTSNDFALVRYNTDGSLDSSFGTGGKTIVDIRGDRDEIRGMVLQNQKIVVAGFASPSFDFALVRFNTDGTLDNTFGVNGKVVSDIYGGCDWVADAAIQSDGKIVVAGGSWFNASFYDFSLARYDNQGTLDTTFGDNGRNTISFANVSDNASAVAIQSDGKIVIAAQIEAGGGTTRCFCLARFNIDGTLDSSFGTNGKVNITFSSDEGPNAIVIQSGKILVAGYCRNNNRDFALLYFNSNGSPDSSFGTNGNGLVTTSIGPGDDVARGLAIQQDGKIIVAGYSYNGSNNDIALVRYNINGTLDTTFGSNGIIITPLGPGNDEACDVADGKIIIGGFIYNGTNYDFVVVRYK